MHSFRRYNPETDSDRLIQIWKDVGWISDDEQHAIVKRYHEDCIAFVGELNGVIGSLSSSSIGSFDFDGVQIPMIAITGVTSGFEFRRQGLAGKVSAKVLSEGFENGAALSILGAFDQGYYEKLGFGNISDDRNVVFDPGRLKVAGKTRSPVRLGEEDWERMHNARISRFTKHGVCNILDAEHTRFEVLYNKNNFGLGFETNGELTHYFFGRMKDKESHGPLEINIFVYQNFDQLLELLSLLKGLSDQVRFVEMEEPVGIKIQEFLDKPFRLMEVTEGNEYATRADAMSVFQARIVDLEKAVSLASYRGKPVSFQLILTDPITRFLDPDDSFNGCQGEYVVELGESSKATKGKDSDLPRLSCSINAFTRLWCGVRSANSLKISDGLEASQVLLDDLDRLIRLPVIKVDWHF